MLQPPNTIIAEFTFRMFDQRIGSNSNPNRKRKLSSIVLTV